MHWRKLLAPAVIASAVTLGGVSVAGASNIGGMGSYSPFIAQATETATATATATETATEHGMGPLVAGLKKIADFQISVAGYPEKHPDSADAKADLENLKRKVDAGADRCITQFFFECDDFLRFRDAAARAGVHVPIVAGVMPVSNFQGIQRMAGLCGAKVPAWLADMFEGLDDDVETRRMIAATVAGDLCRRLHAEGVDQFHFYTLNRADLTFALCHLLGVRPARRPS